MSNYSGADKREVLTADEKLRVTALKAAVDTQSAAGADPEDVEDSARTFYKFLSED